MKSVYFGLVFFLFLHASGDIKAETNMQETISWIVKFANKPDVGGSECLLSYNNEENLEPYRTKIGSRRLLINKNGILTYISKQDYYEPNKEPFERLEFTFLEEANLDKLAIIDTNIHPITKPNKDACILLSFTCNENQECVDVTVERHKNGEILPFKHRNETFIFEVLGYDNALQLKKAFQHIGKLLGQKKLLKN